MLQSLVKPSVRLTETVIVVQVTLLGYDLIGTR